MKPLLLSFVMMMLVGLVQAEESQEVDFQPRTKAASFANMSGFFVSREHGFIAKFHGKVEAMVIETAIGSLISYGSFDEGKLLLYQINVHDITAYRKLNASSVDLIKRLIKSNFDEYCIESEAKQIRSAWSKLTSWPAIEFSCSHYGFLSEGVTSYKRGYAFLRGSKFYKVTVHGLQSNQDLIDASLRFMASLSFPDDQTLKAIEE